MKEHPLLEAKNISKSFMGVKALDDVSLTCYAGEIIGLIGENGAGKSTLMKILAGVYTRDSGTILMDGAELQTKTPAQSQANGIGMVYQDTRLAGDLTVMQNIFLGHEMVKKSGSLDTDGMAAKSRELVSTFGVDISPQRQVRDLTIAQKQLVEIAKALSNPTKLLILDEPTASLTPSEANKLFEVLREIKRNGLCVLFISHRLPEVLSVCDRFVVLRDGRVSGESDRNSADENSLIKMMVGRDPDKFYHRRERKQSTGSVLLEVDNLNSDAFSDISFNVQAGEIVGMFGIQGNGQREIMRTIAGMEGDLYRGNIRVNGNEVTIRKPQDATRAGISCLTDERRTEGVFLPLSIKDNVTVYNLKDVSSGGIVSKKLERENAGKAIDQFNIKCNDEEQHLEELSGGNQQKVIFAANYLKQPKVYLFNEPTVGIDVKSKSEIYEFIHNLAESGAGIIVLSSDIVEIISLSDRILTVSRGKITADIPAPDATEEAVMNGAMAARIKKEKNEEKLMKAPAGKGIISHASILIVIGITIMLAVIGATTSEFFLTPYNLGNIVLQMSPLALIALGQSLVILTGGIDLSVGGMVSLITAVCSFMVATDGSAGGILICVLIGVGVGLMNGLIITKLRIPDIIVTLATMTGVTGVGLLLRPSPGGVIAGDLKSFVNIKFLNDIPLIAIITIALFIIVAIWLKRTRQGTYIYAIGSNKEASYCSGIKIDQVKIFVYVICGILAAVGGIIVAGRIGTGDPRVGNEFTMKSVTAAVVGGVAITGGRGSVYGALVGSLMILMMQNILNMIEVSAYLQYVWVGVIMILSVGLYQVPEWIRAAREKMKNNQKVSMNYEEL